MTPKILIVEDEPDIQAILDYNLRQEGYETILANDGETAIERVLAQPHPSLVVLDWMLPGIGGTEVCRKIRNADLPYIPVLMLTAKSDEVDRVVGFQAGADDYVSKPFSMQEFLLRVRALLRRWNQTETRSEEKKFGAIRLHAQEHRVWVNSEEIPLTALEFRLLKTMMDRRGHVLTRGQLLQDVWNLSSELNTRTVDTHIKRLRRKLKQSGNTIETIRGVGYRFNTRA